LQKVIELQYNEGRGQSNLVPNLHSITMAAFCKFAPYKRSDGNLARWQWGLKYDALLIAD